MSFLDLVRKIGAISRDRCHPDCELTTHRREVASCLGILLENPELLGHLAAIARGAPDVSRMCGDMTGPHGIGGECVLDPGHPHFDGIGGIWPVAEQERAS